MTNRLYYDNAYQICFDATIIERVALDNRIGIILDQTYFYPTSGGQPHDTGTINQIRIIDVYTRVSDAAVVHVIGTPIIRDSVSCVIDWQRRFDHMQHHTGQHILTQAFVQITNANTLSFHLSQDSVTIDLDHPIGSLSQSIIDKVEAMANQVIQENRAVSARIIDPSTAETVRMRKMPHHLTTKGLRVIEIHDFDQTACGGTHVANTGEIGLLKIIKVEKRSNNARIEFLCGTRAVQDYSERFEITSRLSNLLTCHHMELPSIIEKMREELKGTQSQVKALSSQLLDLEVAQLMNTAARIGELNVVMVVFEDRDRSELQNLAARVAEKPKTIFLAGLAGDKSHLIFACHESVSLDLNPLIRQAMEILGGGRGGGRPHMVQGGGMKAASQQIRDALEAVKQSLHA